MKRFFIAFFSLALTTPVLANENCQAQAKRASISCFDRAHTDAQAAGIDVRKVFSSSEGQYNDCGLKGSVEKFSFDDGQSRWEASYEYLGPDCDPLEDQLVDVSEAGPLPDAWFCGCGGS